MIFPERRTFLLRVSAVRVAYEWIHFGYAAELNGTARHGNRRQRGFAHQHTNTRRYNRACIHRHFQQLLTNTSCDSKRVALRSRRSCSISFPLNGIFTVAEATQGAIPQHSEPNYKGNFHRGNSAFDFGG